MNAIVLYKSKYGTTEKYAKWIADELGADLESIDKVKASQLRSHDTIIIGGGIYAGSLNCFNFVKKYTLTLSGKNIFMFAVGASPASRKAVNDLRIKHFTRAIEKIPLFYFRGAWKKSEFGFKDRTLCNMLAKQVAKKSPNEFEPWERALVEAEEAGGDFDWTDKENIKEFIIAVKEGKKAEVNY